MEQEGSTVQVPCEAGMGREPVLARVKSGRSEGVLTIKKEQKREGGEDTQGFPLLERRGDGGISTGHDV